MESVIKPLGCHQACFMFPFSGVVLSVAGALLLTPALTITQKCPDKIFIFIPTIYASLLLLITLNFCLDILLLFLHVVTARAGASETPLPVFSMRRLPQAAHAVNLTTLVLITPLSIHAAAAKESIGMAIGAGLVCLASVTILCSVFKELFISGGFAPPLFALCISTGFITVLDPILFFTHKNQYDLLFTHHISIQLFLMFLSFLVFILGITLLFFRIGTSADGGHTAIQAENLVVGAMSVSIATLLLGGYIMLYMELIDMEAVGVGAVEM